MTETKDNLLFFDLSFILIVSFEYYEKLPRFKLDMSCENAGIAE